MKRNLFPNIKTFQSDQTSQSCPAVQLSEVGQNDELSAVVTSIHEQNLVAPQGIELERFRPNTSAVNESGQEAQSCPAFQLLEVGQNDEPFFGIDIGNVDDYPHGKSYLLIINEAPTNEIVQSRMKVDACTQSVKSRKRQRHEDCWKQNIRKRNWQLGLEYTSRKNQVVAARKPVANDCQHTGLYQDVFHCREFDTHYVDIHKRFWDSAAAEKQHFLGRTTEPVPKKQRRTASDHSRRQFSFKYYLYIGDVKLQVCQQFYLKCLNIDRKRVEHYYKALLANGTGIPLAIRQGKHPKRKATESQRQAVIKHISSFPAIESHYCRSDSSRKYIDPLLSVSRMYALFCEQSSGPVVIKESYYRGVFNANFNIGFHVPKKDRCNKCEKFRILSNATEAEKQSYEAHKQCQEQTKLERDNDRAAAKASPEHAFVCFDLENVFALPRANVSNFFYRRKFSVFNMTAHCSLNQEAYCAVWNEALSGRSCNNMASSVVAICERIVQTYRLRKLTLWSDSCVAQNRNCAMSYALMEFMQRHPEIVEIEQKFGCPGHSPIQEVDNIHSQIERRLKKHDIYSPVGLLKMLKTVNWKNPLQVIQMQKDNILNFKDCAKVFRFDRVPFSKVKSLLYRKCEPNSVAYNNCFVKESVVTVDINPSAHTTILPKANAVAVMPCLDERKMKDLEEMLPYMPEIDRLFYSNLIAAQRMNTASPVSR